MRRHSPVARSPARRRGAALVEGGIVAMLVVLILIAMVDLGLAVLQYNTVSEAARRLARAAAVHGHLAPPERTEWGPEPYAGSAADGSEFAQAVLPMLVAMEPAEVQLALEWPDAANDADRRVRATVAYPHRPVLPFLFGGSWTLSAVSTLRIMH